MKTAITRIALAVTALVVVGSLSVGQAGKPDTTSDYAKAKAQYDKYIKRPSFAMRTRGRTILAQTGDVRALKVFQASYPKPDKPEEQVRSLLASIANRYITGMQAVPVYQEWRNANVLSRDAWLWFQSMRVTHQYTGDAELEAIAKDTKKDIFIRAAVMEAMADLTCEQALMTVFALIPEAREAKGTPRMILLESMARLFYTRGHELGTDNFRKVGLEFIPLMDAKETLERTRLVMARYFREIFGGSNLWINADAWLEKLLNPEKPEDPANSKYKQPPAPPTKFIGVESSGMRIVYVIDLSDSMMTPMSVKEKEEIKKPPPPPPKKGPVTGRGEGGKGEGDAGKKDEPKPEEPPPEEKEKDVADEMPWDKIKCRFHAAREYLKLSLKSLQPQQQFCVIVFGSEAKTLTSTKGLVKATPEAIANTIRELDKIKPGPKQDDRPHGTLMGYTNLHGGMHRAFKVKEGGLVAGNEYVDPSTFLQGADTIFLLSDGDPTWDDWVTVDKRDPYDQVGDPESRTKQAEMDDLEFPGPYGYHPNSDHQYWLADDVMRENLFRKCEIHCIGIGEVSYGLLASIAKAALGGQVKMVGGK